MVSDVDGLFLLFGLDAYERYHHALAHNLLFGSGVVLVAARWVGLGPWPLALVAAAFLSHLVGDYLGSGPGWGLWPFRPFSEQYYECRCAWDLVSWQNTAITAAALAAAVWLAVRRGHTPLEFVDAALDRRVVLTLRLRTTGLPCHWCPVHAVERCQSCGRPACPAHLAGRRWLRPRCRDCG